jgi:hypothetical protein
LDKIQNLEQISPNPFQNQERAQVFQNLYLFDLSKWEFTIQTTIDFFMLDLEWKLPRHAKLIGEVPPRF